jgi:transposase, IS5 family
MLLKSRRLLEQHGLTRRLLETLHGHLAVKGLFKRMGSVGDATLIAALSWTKNHKGERVAEMPQTKKGKQYYFGMKVHVGAGMGSVIVHSLVGTAANVGDVTGAHRLLHGDEEVAFGDAGYEGVHKRPEVDPEHAVYWQVAMKPRQRRQLDRAQPLDELKDEVEKLKASIRAKVEHPFQLIRQRFGYRKVRYRHLAKNTAQMCTLFALANLVRVRKRLSAFGR